MDDLQPNDKVEWRAGKTPATSHIRRGVIKEILPGGTALVATEVEGKTVIEEIRSARLRKAEIPAPAKVKKAGTKREKKAKEIAPARGKKAARKKAAAKV